MADTTYVDSTTLLTANTMNDLNRLHYTILGDPADAAAVRTAIGSAALAGSASQAFSALAVNTAKTTVASATTPDIFAATTGQLIDYTGTATCTGFVAAPQAGMFRTLYCTGAAVFTAGANLLIDGVASGSNLTCVAGDILDVVAITTTQFKITIRKNPIVLGTVAPTINSGFGSGASVVNNNGSVAFTVNVGSGGTAFSGILTMPSAPNGWKAMCVPHQASGNYQANALTYGFPSSQTALILNNRKISDGSNFAWETSGYIDVFAIPY